MELTWLGHASFKLKAKGKVIFFDPFKWKLGEKADIILCSHEHFDHSNKEMIADAMADSTAVFSSKGVAAEIEGAVGMIPGQQAEHEGVIVTAVQAYNVNKRFHPKGLGVGFIVEVEGKKIYHAGDTDIIPEMSSIKCDVALLPVSGTYVMTAKEAAMAVKAIKPNIAVPMHYGEVVGTLDDAELFKELVEKETETKVIVMRKGETIGL